MQKIMFNDKYRLNKAVLDGLKTHTRRIVTDRLFQECRSNGLIYAGGFNDEWKTKSMELLVKNSPYKIGEEVAIAQNYNDVIHIVDDNKRAIIDKIPCNNKGWSNKMFVRADLMPHRIKITDIRVERLQDISDEDCMKEGIIKYSCYGFLAGNIRNKKGTYIGWKTPKEAFAYLIDKTCGKGTWDSNPYVFVYEFELIK